VIFEPLHTPKVAAQPQLVSLPLASNWMSVHAARQAWFFGLAQAPAGHELSASAWVAPSQLWFFVLVHVPWLVLHCEASVHSFPDGFVHLPPATGQSALEPHLVTTVHVPPPLQSELEPHGFVVSLEHNFWLHEPCMLLHMLLSVHAWNGEVLHVPHALSNWQTAPELLHVPNVQSVFWVQAALLLRRQVPPLIGHSLLLEQLVAVSMLQWPTDPHGGSVGSPHDPPLMLQTPDWAAHWSSASC